MGDSKVEQVIKKQRDRTVLTDLHQLMKEKSYEEILSALPEETDDMTLEEKYFELYALNRLQRYSEVINLFQKAENSLDQLKTVNRLKYYYEYLIALFRKGAYHQAESVIEQLQPVIEGLDFAELTKEEKQRYASYYNHAGIIQYTQQNYERAMEFYQTLKDLGERVPDQRVLIVALTNIALIYDKLGQYSDAIDNYEVALQQDEISDDTKVTIYNNLSSLYVTIGELDKAENYCNRGIELADEIDDSLTMSKLLTNRGELFRKRGSLNKAINDFKSSYEYKKKVGDPHESVITLFYLVETYLDLNQRKRAMNYLEDLKSMTDDLESEDIRATYLLAEALYLKDSTYYKHKHRAERLLRETIETTKDAMTRIIASVHLLELLISELPTPEENEAIPEEERDKIQQELLQIYNNIMSTEEIPDTPIVRLQIHYIRAYLHLFFLQPELVQHELDKAEEITTRTGLKMVDIHKPEQQEDHQHSIKPVLQQSFNKIIHAEPRLKIILALLNNSKLVFRELQDLVGLTPGNLGRHCDKLVEAGYVDKNKEVIDDKFLTVYNITNEGIAEFQEYKSILEHHFVNS